MAAKVASVLAFLLVACGETPRGRGGAVAAPTSGPEPAPGSSTVSLREPAWLPGMEAPAASEGDEPESLVELAEEDAARRTPPSEVWMELVHEGPLARATHPGGGPMYEGQQIEQDGRWVRHGRFEAWYPDGQAWEAGSYYLDRPHGLWEWWYEDGTPQARGSYEEGQHTGPWTYWYENGQVMATGVFRADKPVGVWRLYDEQGNLVDESDRGP